MLGQIAYASQFGDLLSSVEQLHTLLVDTVLRAESQAWNAATANYTTLKRLSRSNGPIAKAIKPLVDAFATGKRPPKADVPKKPEAPAAPAAKPAVG
jgi:hypothetical protein